MKRKQGRPNKSASGTGVGQDGLPFICPPLLAGEPVGMRRADDTNCCMSIHGPERVRDGFEEIKGAYGNLPGWAVLQVLVHHFLDQPPEHARLFVEARRRMLERGEDEGG